MNKLTIIILTYNEQRHIKECIESAKFANEILVVDSGSSDDTVRIAQDNGARVISHPITDGFAAQRNFALKQANTEWVMFLDADERITPKLAGEIIQAVKSDSVLAYEIPRRNIAFGHWLRYGGWYPDYCLRLYPRTEVVYDGIVHEKAIVNIAKQKLKYPLDHYTYDDWDRYFIKFNSYTTLMASQLYEKGKRANILSIVFRPIWAFFRTYILKLGFLDGKMGFIMAAFHYFYTMAKYVKLYYMQRSENI
ncbi:MAG: glycosyltransferase family 2 protein [Veillonellaceae bacterium]|nr:glycosyltransferase family 2 protein [Veillonellaceae bacterium]